MTGKGEAPWSFFSVLINLLGCHAKTWNYEGERRLRANEDIAYTIVRPGVMGVETELARTRSRSPTTAATSRSRRSRTPPSPTSRRGAGLPERRARDALRDDGRSRRGRGVVRRPPPAVRRTAGLPGRRAAAPASAPYASAAPRSPSSLARPRGARCRRRGRSCASRRRSCAGRWVYSARPRCESAFVRRCETANSSSRTRLLYRALARLLRVWL